MPRHHASARSAVTELQPVELLTPAPRLHQAERPDDQAVRLARQPAQARDDEGLFWLPDNEASARPAHAAPEPMPAEPATGSSMMPAVPDVAEPVTPTSQGFPLPGDSGIMGKGGMLGSISGAAPTLVAVSGLAATAGGMVWAVDDRSADLRAPSVSGADGGGHERAQTTTESAVAARLPGVLPPAEGQASVDVIASSYNNQATNDQSEDDLPIQEVDRQPSPVSSKPDGLAVSCEKPVSDTHQATSILPNPAENSANAGNAATAGHEGDEAGESDKADRPDSAGQSVAGVGATTADSMANSASPSPATNTVSVADGPSPISAGANDASVSPGATQPGNSKPSTGPDKPVESGDPVTPDSGHATDVSQAGHDASAGNAAGAGNAGHAGTDPGSAGAAPAGGGADSSAAAAGAQPDAAGADPADTGAQSAQAQVNTLRQIPPHLFEYYSEAFLGDGNTIPYLQVTRIVEYQDENGVIDALRLGGRDEPLKVGDLIAAADYDKVFWDGGSNRGGLLAMAPIKEDRTPYIDGYYSEFDIPSIKGLSVPAGHAGGLSGSMMLLEVPPDHLLWAVG